jgi:hypothetical protein
VAGAAVTLFLAAGFFAGPVSLLPGRFLLPRFGFCLATVHSFPGKCLEFSCWKLPCQKFVFLTDWFILHFLRLDPTRVNT